VTTSIQSDILDQSRIWSNLQDQTKYPI